MENLEKRLKNAEQALVSLAALIETSLNRVDRNAANKMMEEFFYANMSLGATFENPRFEFDQDNIDPEYGKG